MGVCGAIARAARQLLSVRMSWSGDFFDSVHFFSCIGMQREYTFFMMTNTQRETAMTQHEITSAIYTANSWAREWLEAKIAECVGPSLGRDLAKSVASKTTTLGIREAIEAGDTDGATATMRQRYATEACALLGSIDADRAIKYRRLTEAQADGLLVAQCLLSQHQAR